MLVRSLLAALVVAVSFVTAHAQDTKAAAAADEGSTRWSTVHLARQYKVDPKTIVADIALKDRIKSESGPAIQPHAVAAGAELVWDLSGESLIGISPVLYADPALALPGAAPARVLTVDMARLYDNHPKTLTQNARIQAHDQSAQEKVDQMNAAGNALVAEYKKLAEGGDKAGAAKKLAQIEAKQTEIKAFIKETRSDLEGQLKTFRAAMLQEISAGVVPAARARGATLVLDTAGPSLIGASNLVYIAPALLPAADGGVRDGDALVAKVRTVDLIKLYDRHPKTLEQNALLKADHEKARQELARMNKAGEALVEEYKQLAKRGETPASAKKLEQITAQQNEVKAHNQKTEDALKKRIAAHRKTTLAELAKTSGEVAQRAGATLLLDTSGASHLGVSYIVYAAPKLDLTDEIAREMKK